MVSATKLFVVGLQSDLICLITYKQPLPAIRYTIEGVYKKIPVSREIHTEDAILERSEPLKQCRPKVLAREHTIRILT
ncbi:hypothetical protein WI91_01105 [Burkholderia vietnamiensis]|nr:hypothetical protein WI91_01105 [Burkholderia vietnamiensis]